MSDYCSRFHWLADDLREVGDAELEFGPPTVYVDRMTAESCDFFDVRDENQRITRLIARRSGENVAHPVQDLEEPDEVEEPNDDAMSHREIGAPKEKWDLRFWTEMRRKPGGSWVKVEASAPWYPSRRDCRPKGYMSVLEKLVRQGKLKRKGLFLAVRTGLKDRKLTKVQAKRLWEVAKLTQVTPESMACMAVCRFLRVVR